MCVAPASGAVHVVAPIIATCPLLTPVLRARVFRNERRLRGLFAPVGLAVAGVAIWRAWREPG